MLTFLFLSLIAASIFWIVGYGFVNRVSSNSKFAKEISVIFGFSLLIFSTYIIAYFGVSIWILPGTFLLAVFYSLRRIWKLRESLEFSFSTSKLLKEMVVFSIGSITYAVTQSSSVWLPRLHLRTGPDLMGWTISSNYFVQSNSVNELIASVTKKLSSTDRLELFSSTNAAHSVYSLASFNEQVSSEFLMGSNRIGLPALVGFISRFTDLPAFILLWTLVCCFGGVIALISFKFLSRSSFPNILRNTSFATVVGSSAIIAPIVEGGIWQIFMVPCLLLSLISLYELQHENRFQDLSVIALSISLLIVSLTTDVLIVSTPLLLVCFIALFYKRALWSLMWFFIAFALPLLFGVQILKNSLLSRSRDALVGGWSAAALPLPADLYGLTPWQESTGRFDGTFFYSPSKIVLSTLLTFLFVYLIAAGNSWGRKLTLLYLFFSLIIISLSYIPRVTSGAGNNYIPWKLAFVFGVTFPIIICAFVESTKAITTTADLTHIRSRKHKLTGQRKIDKPVVSDLKLSIIWAIMLLEVLQFARWHIDWSGNSTSNAPVSFATNSLDSDLHREIRSTLNKYDFIGGCVPWVNALGISGDFRSLSLRGESIQPRESIPERKKVFVLDSSLAGCKKYSELLGTDSPVANLGSLQIFDVTSRIG